ncbi:hypothetical protein DM02DRAFT_257995 [Periconia macrospinosa]|uniref:Uncharacterized protein n=1 Tax=Periconia macrospinosa TaxID=97972 RepID=A0A2V1E1S3_9PLEO|nr:hypothetical protein DM02DRAFT_257995 [Periconia macrospinosa]
MGRQMHGGSLPHAPSDEGLRRCSFQAPHGTRARCTICAGANASRGDLGTSSRHWLWQGRAGQGRAGQGTGNLVGQAGQEGERDGHGDGDMTLGLVAHVEPFPSNPLQTNIIIDQTAPLHLSIHPSRPLHPRSASFLHSTHAPLPQPKAPWRAGWAGWCETRGRGAVTFDGVQKGDIVVNLLTKERNGSKKGCQGPSPIPLNTPLSSLVAKEKQPGPWLFFPPQQK